MFSNVQSYAAYIKSIEKDRISHLKQTNLRNIRANTTISDDENLQIMSSWLSSPPKLTSLRLTNIDSITAMDICTRTIQQFCKDRGIYNGLQVEMHPYLSDTILVEMTGPHPVQVNTDKLVVVDVMAGQAIMRGADLFKAGVIAMSPSIVKGDMVSVVVDIEGKCLKGAIKYSGLLVHIGNGVSQVSRDELFVVNNGKRLNGTGICITHPVFQTIPDGLLPPHHFFMQNIPSLLVAHALDPSSSDMILDMCASPGGKTSHVLSLLVGNNNGSNGHVHAIDKSPKKCEKILETLKRLCLPLDKVTVMAMDACDALTKFPECHFDKIILDPTCTGIGQRPCLSPVPSVLLTEPNCLDGKPKIQKRLFEVAEKLLKPNGLLVYSTCSINPNENEWLVEWALSRYGNKLELVDVRQRLNCKNIGRSGISVGDLTLKDCDKMIRFDHALFSGSENEWPPVDDTIGFFLVLFRKIS